MQANESDSVESADGGKEGEAQRYISEENQTCENAQLEAEAEAAAADGPVSERIQYHHHHGIEPETSLPSQLQGLVPLDVHITSYEEPSLNGQDTKAPAVLYARLVQAGRVSAERTYVQLISMGFLAGVLIGIGAYLAGFIGGAIEQGFLSFSQLDHPLKEVANLKPVGTFLFGLYGLPMSLLGVVTFGAELFTGNCLTVTTALIEQKVGIVDYFRVLIINWFSNLVGNLFIVAFAAGADIIDENAKMHFIELAELKATSRSLSQLICASVLANFLVTTAIAFAQSTGSFAGRTVGILLPGSAFIALGLEHAIANMSFIPLGMLFTPTVNVSHFLFNNLAIVSVGNWIGGAVVLACPLSCCYGTPAKHMSKKTIVI